MSNYLPEWKGYRVGNHIFHPRLGECEFYRFDQMRQTLEVFDRYGIVRYLKPDEWEFLDE